MQIAIVTLTVMTTPAQGIFRNNLFPKHEFGQTSKFTHIFKVPGLADGNGYTMYDATSDLAYDHLFIMDAKSDKLSSFSESAFIFSGFSKL